jgi:hypothetical protein
MSRPPAPSFAQKRSISFWSLQFTTNDTASVNLKIGPPFSATKRCPASWKSTVITDPTGPIPPSP